MFTPVNLVKTSLTYVCLLFLLGCFQTTAPYRQNLADIEQAGYAFGVSYMDYLRTERNMSTSTLLQEAEKITQAGIFFSTARADGESEIRLKADVQKLYNSISNGMLQYFEKEADLR